MPNPTAIEAANKFRAQLARREAESITRMGRLYARIYNGILADLDALADEIAVAPEIDRNKILRYNRLREILAQISAEVERFGATVDSEVVSVKLAGLESGVADAAALIKASLPPLPDDISAGLVGSINLVHTDALEAAAGLMGNDSPLRAKLESTFGPYVAMQVSEGMLKGIAVGMNPRRIAQLLQRNALDGLGVGLSVTTQMIRTAQIKSYQLANHAVYQANPHLVKGWVWHAKLGDLRTCMSCVAMHGTIHPITETLNDHHSGRRAPLPITPTYREMGIDIDEPFPPAEAGEAWFVRQPKGWQIEAMGAAMHKAWQAGEFKFSELSRPYTDDVYGELLREASLKDLLGDRARLYYRQKKQ